MESTERYLQLSRLGRVAFLAGAAPAALVRARNEGSGAWTAVPRRARPSTGPNPAPRPTAPMRLPSPPPLHPHPDDEETIDITSSRRRAPSVGEIQVFPLAKKPGASFPELITVGRTANNDIVLKDVTVSRFHAFFRQREAVWVVGDAGSKNGTQVDGAELEARKEHGVLSGANVRIGDLELTFYTAEQLFEMLIEGAA